MIYITNSFITWNLLIRNASETRRRLRWKVCSKTTYGQCQPPGDLICWQNADSRSHLRSKPVYTHGLPLIGFRTNAFTVQKKPTYCQKNKSTLQEPVYYPTLFETKKNLPTFQEKKQNERFRAKETAVVVATAVASSATWFGFPSLPL